MHLRANRFALQRTLIAALVTCVSCLLGGWAFSQSFVYTHTSGLPGDGFTWDNPLPAGPNNLGDGDAFTTPDSVDYYNYSGNISFFDSNYQVASNSGRINGDAWWMNPLEGGDGQLGFAFFDALEGSVDTFGFDFAWATNGQDAPSFLSVEVFDYDANQDGDTYLYSNSILLGETFSGFGGFNGSTGRIHLDVADLLDDNTGEALTSIDEVLIYIDEVATLGGTSEVAIDNVAVNSLVSSNGSNVFPSFNQGMNGSGITFTLNILKDTGSDTRAVTVTNDGTDSTTFTTELVPGSEFTDAGQSINRPINAGQSIFGASQVAFDTNRTSGDYSADIRVINDTNTLDTDDIVTLNNRVHDLPELSANNSSTIDLNSSTLVTLSNASSGPHAGAYRAGVDVVSTILSGPFAMVGVQAGEEVLPGQTLNGTASFHRYGQLSKEHFGGATAQMEMVSHSGVFLAGAAPVADISWNFSFNHTDVLTDSVPVGQDESYRNIVGVNTATSAATLVEGTSSTSQTVSMDIVANTGTNGTVVSDAVDLGFSSNSGLYVLQFTYDPASVPSGVNENDLRLLVLDETASTWSEATEDNSDGGAGGSLFLGSFLDYLSGPGGGLLDSSDLSNFGVDSAAGTAWAVLDHASIFSLGVLTSTVVAGDYNNDGTVDIEDYTRWRDNLGAAAGTLPNDVDGGTIGADQYLTWQAEFESASNLEQSTVPEPGAGLLLATLLVGLVGRFRYIQS